MEMVCSGIEDGKRLTEPIVLHRDGLWIDSVSARWLTFIPPLMEGQPCVVCVGGCMYCLY